MNKNKKIDLHIHTTMSDGSVNPKDICAFAKRFGVAAAAITDHNTFEGMELAKKSFDENNIELVFGIEISCEYEPEIHILCYFFDERYKNLIPLLEKINNKKYVENPKKIINKLNKLGYKIDYQQMVNKYGASLRTMDILNELVLKKYFNRKRDAYDELFAKNKKVHMKNNPSYRLILKKVIKNGGIPVLAHPYKYNFSSEEILILVKKLKKYGLVGIEAYHSEHSYDETKKVLLIAKEFKLIATGGSDYHGKLKPTIDIGIGKGELNINYSVLEKLKEHYKLN